MIYLGADHGGFKLKQAIIQYLANLNLEYKDLGNLKFKKDDDYPEYAYQVAKAVAKGKGTKGILICGTSYGVCIAANKVKGARAVSVNNIQDAKFSREHNDANILCLSGWDSSIIKAKKIIKAWLNTKFSTHPRHRRRVNQIKQIESKEFK